MNNKQIETWVRGLISSNNIHVFYTSTMWLKIRDEVIREHNYECQHCKALGKYTKANTVHHEKYVRKYPELALSKTYIHNGKEYRNLTPLCDECHKRVHARRYKKPLTKERW